MPKQILTEKDRQRFNRDLKDLDLIEADIKTALEAGFDRVKPLLEQCQECRSRIINSKKAYFPNRP